VVGGFGGRAGPVTVQTTMEFVEQFVMLHRFRRRRLLVHHRFRRVNGQKIVRERRADVVHLADDEAAKV
jgi:hypothetical protein